MPHNGQAHARFTAARFIRSASQIKFCSNATGSVLWWPLAVPRAPNGNPLPSRLRTSTRGVNAFRFVRTRADRAAARAEPDVARYVKRAARELAQPAGRIAQGTRQCARGPRRFAGDRAAKASHLKGD